MKFPNQDVYHGLFVDGAMQGFGEMKYHDGGSYVGNWHQDKIHGQGHY